MDAVVANYGTDTIEIFLSINNNTSDHRNTYPTGPKSRPYSIVISDFNNDTHLDICVANYGVNNIGLFLGTGNGTFGNQKVFSTGSSHPLFIATSDFNQDNQSDIAVVHYGTDSIGILLGLGNGSFQPQMIYTTGYDSVPNSLAIGDFNEDNKLDIVVVNSGTDNIVIFLGFGNGTFANSTTYTTTHNSNPSSVAVGDFNHDHHLDVVVTNYHFGNIAIFLGHGNGSFTVQTKYAISSKSRPNIIAVGSFDNDNYLDVVVLDAENDQVHIILGYGNGSFGALTTYDSVTGARPVAVAVADFDNDNQSDIAVVNNGTNNLLVLSEYSMKPSARHTNYFVGRDSRPSSVVVYDFNNDGNLDIAVDNFNDNYILILNGMGDGTFVEEGKHPSGARSAPQYECVADLNNDGRIDMIVANVGSDSFSVFLGQDNGTFAPVTIYSTGVGSAPWFVAVGDVNSDNLLDIVSTNTGVGGIGVFLGYGNGTFYNYDGFSVGIGSTPFSAALGDVNHDKHLDIVVAIALPDHMVVLLGHGNGTFGAMTSYATGIDSNPFMALLVDLNRDTHLDVTISNWNSGNVIIFFGNGDGTFRERVSYPTGSGSTSSPYYVIAAYFNNDDYYDLIISNLGINQVVIFFGDGNGTFELARTYETGLGSTPYGVAAGDLNNDGHLEIVVSYWGNGYVSVLTEYYVAAFENKAIYLTGSAPNPYSLAVADFNNDSRSDIVVANSGTDDLGIFLGLGNGTFAPKIKYSIATDSYPQYVITGDINSDNHMDIVSVNSKSNTISVIHGNGNGIFADQTMYSTGDNSHPYAVAISDFNNDQRVDFVIANEGTDSIGILLGYNYRSFQSSITYLYENTRAPNDVSVHDFNHDNHLDMVIVYRDSFNLAVLLGNGNGSFGAMTSYSTGYYSFPSKLAVNDFNGDTQLDIAVANYGSDSVGVFLGYGNGSFTNMITYSTGAGSTPISIDVGDFNNDGLFDIVTANNGNYKLGILLGYGNGSFAAVILYSTGDHSFPHGVAVGDFNNDGQLDISVANYGPSTATIFLGHGNGTFEIQASYSVGDQSWPWAIAVADFNSDNLSDIAVANYNNNNIGILLGTGNGYFTTVATYSSGDGSAPEGLGIGDFNNDNILDIAVANFIRYDIVVLFGFGDGTFLSGAPYPTGLGSGSTAIATGDFNNDNRLDIFVANYLSNSIMLFLGYDYEPFAGVTRHSTGDGSQPHSVAVADFNNDGWSDIVVANYGTDTVGILLGYGHGFFEPMITYSTGDGSAPYSVAIADFDNDNQSDIVVVTSETDNVAILHGHGDGTFTMGATYSTGARSRPYTVSTGDLDNDNRTDLVITNSGTNQIFVLYGHGNGTFRNMTSYTLGYEYHPYSVAIADLNGDNWLDIIISCYGTDYIETYIKMC